MSVTIGTPSFSLAALLLVASVTESGNSQPLPVPSHSPFRGQVEIDVDATDSAHRRFVIHETIPVQSSGETVLLYPEWETASHAPTVSPIGLAGLRLTVDGRPVAWRRSPVDMHSFRIDVPTGGQQIRLSFEFLAPRRAAWLRPDMVVVSWQHLLLYPSGYDVHNVSVAATLHLTPGLRAFSSLQSGTGNHGTIDFAPVAIDRLVDAPVYAARHARTFDLTPGESEPVTLDVLADSPSSIAVTPYELAAMRRMVAQSVALFGPAPYRHYDAIVTLSDVLSPGGGTEHLEEGENNLPADYFTDAPHELNNRDLIVHELVHAWNGRFRMPADMVQPDYNTPVGGSLLWFYEGQTEFWGRVLAARAGLRSRQQTLDKLALDAAIVANRPGRDWKTLADSLNDPIYMAEHAVDWRDWQRREDYYPEGVLLWLDVDARLRELTDGRRSLNDFARAFFATRGRNGFEAYTLADLCEAFSRIFPGEDWTLFLSRHLETHQTGEATAGLARAGWRLVYTDVPSATFQQDEDRKTDLSYSAGLTANVDGTVSAVAWQGPAWRAGLDSGDRITHVNGTPFSKTALTEAVKAAGRTPLMLEFDDDGAHHRVTVPYSGTLRYPRLERIPGTPDRLSELLDPL